MLDEERFEFVHELIHVLEPAVYAGKPHIGNLIQAAQFFDDHVADFFGGHFPHLAGGEGRLHRIDDGHEIASRHRQFFTRPEQAVEEFLAVEALAPPVLLDDGCWKFVDPFVGGESLFALRAFTAASNLQTVPDVARIDDPVVGVSAERAIHPAAPPRWTDP